MDILAAHRHGLIEQLDEEVSALAGRAGDHAQRAMVLHHLYDHSRGLFGWALAEARQELRIASGIAALGRGLERWGWLTGRSERAREALDSLAQALGRAGAARTAAGYRAYRLSGTAALRGEAEEQLSNELFAALDECHRARRLGVECAVDVGSALASEIERLCSDTSDRRAIDAAWLAIDLTALGRRARRLLGDQRLARMRERDERRSGASLEAELRNNPALPATFRANPAQHFYALQQVLRERRRQQWREECDREPDAFELAA